MNLLYNNWSIASPGKDSTKAATTDPTKVHFTNRWFAPVPQRIHTHQISVRPITNPYRPLTIGTLTKYLNHQIINVHIWILPNPQLTIESAHVVLKSMQDEIRRIIRILGETAGSNIQHSFLGSWQDRSELDREPPRIHEEARLELIVPETAIPVLLADIGTTDQTSAG